MKKKTINSAYSLKSPLSVMVTLIFSCVASDDHSIPPVLKRRMGKKTGGKVYEIKASHVVYVSHAKEVAAIIETAAKRTRIN